VDIRLQARLFEHGLQRHAGPSTVADQALDRTTVARALEAGNELGVAHLAQIVERQRER
jgi:hypothetical protein